MHSFSFNPRSRAPIVTALVKGPKRARRLRLIFDTGAEMTQFHSATMLEIGYESKDAIAKASVVGAEGVQSEGYVINLHKLIVLGSEAQTFNVGVFDMQHLQARRLDGLLGWDVIRAFHLEMDGPRGSLKVF